jgi:hypothetical protein
MSNAWESAFFRLYDWLESDRDRRSMVIRADNSEIWWVALYIDKTAVNAESGVDLPQVVADVMTGMVVELDDVRRKEHTTNIDSINVQE